MISIKELKKFIHESKTNTFASGNGKKILENGFTRYSFKKNNLLYTDEFIGDLIDIGIEIVKYKEIPVWGMSYTGGMLKGYEQQSRETFSFLKECLMNPQEEMPLRGPEIYKKNNLIYLNKTEGNFSQFKGEELIINNNEKIYSRQYMGRMLI